MSKKEGKKFHCGAKFGLIIDKENRARLREVAIEATNAENWLWETLRKYDPVDHEVMSSQVRDPKTKKFPPLPKYFYGNYHEYIGVKCYDFVKSMCPRLHSKIWSVISREVGNEYYKNRLDILRHKRKVSIAIEPRIRFNQSMIRIVRSTKGYDIKLYLFSIVNRKRQPPIVCGLNTKKSRHWWRKWLEEVAGGPGPCGGKIICREGRWFITLSREKYCDEVDHHELRDDCTAYLTAPDPDCSDDFLKLVMEGRDNRPWHYWLNSSAYTETIKRSYIAESRKRGQNFRQSRSRSSARGHGVKRKDASRLPRQTKENIDTRFIETRTNELLRVVAERGKCATLIIEDLVDRHRRDGRAMFGCMNFPYYKFTQRLEQKAAERGIKTEIIPAFGMPESIETYLREKVYG